MKIYFISINSRVDGRNSSGVDKMEADEIRIELIDYI